MYSLSETEIANFIYQYLLPFFRISMMFMVMPVLGSKMLSSRVRLVLAALVTVLIVPYLPVLPATSLLSLQTLISVTQELAIGFIAGQVMQIAFQVFVLAGQFMAMKMGLGFAAMNDPASGTQTTALSQFFSLLTTLVFVILNGHILMLDILIKSFYTLPPGQWHLTSEMFYEVAQMGGWMFSAALIFTLPIFASLMLVNIAFGVMSRSAPQLNIFAVGFPFTLLVGLLLVWLGLINFLPAFDNVMDYGFEKIALIFSIDY